MEQVEKLPQVKNEEQKSKSLWMHAFEQLIRDPFAKGAFIIVAAYAIVAILSGLGVIAGNWDMQFGDGYMAPSLSNIFGTDLFGRSVFLKTIKGTEVAMSVGLVTAIISMIIGVALGATAGYFGGKVDEIIVWFYKRLPVSLILCYL